MKILCFTGWGQKYDSLEFIFKNSFEDNFFDSGFIKNISSFNYTASHNFLDLINHIKSHNNFDIFQPDVIIGWSLGGQIAVRLIEKKILSPKLLILISPPFQFVKNNKIQAAMSQKTFSEFYQNFSSSPNQTLKKFSILTAMNDVNSREIFNNLEICDDNFNQLQSWLLELEKFSCHEVDFSNFPRTLFFQGSSDMIVHVSQAEYFRNKIANFRLEIFSKCGHAPHLNDLKKMRKIIAEEIFLL